MKFVCERCHTRYSIADDKVRQKILKIRYKTCENVITVRDPGSSAIEKPVSAPQPQPPPPPARGVTPPPLAREWFVAVNGEQAGPVNRIEAAKRVSEAHTEDEIYVWKEGLDGWKPPHEVPAIQQELNALRARTAAPPPPRQAPGLTLRPVRRRPPRPVRSAKRITRRSSRSTPPCWRPTPWPSRPARARCFRSGGGRPTARLRRPRTSTGSSPTCRQEQAPERSRPRRPRCTRPRAPIRACRS